MTIEVNADGTFKGPTHRGKATSSAPVDAESREGGEDTGEGPEVDSKGNYGARASGWSNARSGVHKTVRAIANVPANATQTSTTLCREIVFSSDSHCLT